MPFMLVTHKVADFDTWKSEFDTHVRARRTSGLIDLHVMRDDSDPNTVVLLFGTTDLDKAREFIASNELHAVMRNAGVLGQPRIQFLNESHWNESH